MLKVLAGLLLSMAAAVAFGRGSVTHPVAHLEVLPPADWSVSYCTISGPAYAYAWATPTNGETCNFAYLNYAGTYTINVYEESPTRGPVTSEQVTIAPLAPGQSVPTVIIQMEAE
jgi:hypothetical protein